jgi:hypothetical protein
VWLAAEHLSPASFDRLGHEYELKDELDSTWAARPLELVHEDGRTMLVFEDPIGTADHLRRADEHVDRSFRPRSTSSTGGSPLEPSAEPTAAHFPKDHTHQVLGYLCAPKIDGNRQI